MISDNGHCLANGAEIDKSPVARIASYVVVYVPGLGVEKSGIRDNPALEDAPSAINPTPGQ